MNRRAFLNLASATLASAALPLDYAIAQGRRDGLLGEWSLVTVALPNFFPYEVRTVNTSNRMDLDRELLTDIGPVTAQLDGEPLGILGLDAESRTVCVLFPRELRGFRLRENRTRWLRIAWPGGTHTVPVTTTQYGTAPAWNYWAGSSTPVGVVQDATGVWLWTPGLPLIVREQQVVQLWAEGIIGARRFRRGAWLELFTDGRRERVDGRVTELMFEGQTAFTFAPPLHLRGLGRCKMTLCTLDAVTETVDAEIL